ncbi:glycosyl transferase family 1 [Burkholderia sp. MSMB1072]|uniref:glycosyltransferase family 4 protein n=1 Tax=Burkholderia sp. MSMB1072 TaxID=1637871 RepID=UPI0007571E6F|nr:glycosyltransferase family 1 protein [Burkholderia sp. MSMB1072]KVH59333.1 glycosyl transferase family 1 [Burkholderia sp. MSMB1072]
MSRTIAIDGHNLALQHGTGVATYAKNLADAIASMGWGVHTVYGAPVSHRVPALLREVSFFDYLGGIQTKRSAFSEVMGWVKEVLTSPFGRTAVEIPVTGSVEIRRFASRLPQQATVLNVEGMFGVARRHFQRYGRFLEIKGELKPDVMHWTYPLPIRYTGVPNIYTIHDLVPLKLPYTTLDNKRYYFRLIRECVRSGDLICTVSEQSKRDIVDLFDVPEERVFNTYQAVESSWGNADRSRSEVEHEVAGLYGLQPGGYFLFFGAIEPKKNVGRLVEAFLSVPLDASLVIVGSLAWKSAEEMKLVESLLKMRPELRHRIRVFDYAPRPFLVSLVRSAKAVVFPSLYEGFGLPVLEAMQLGTPTLSSTEGSLPEIAGDATLSVDPYDVTAIARGLTQLDRDSALRTRLAAAGIERAGRFNMAIYRARLNELYQRVF